LARCVGDEAHLQQEAFARGLEQAQLQGRFDPAPDPNFARLSQALNELRGLRPLAKPRLVKACADTVLADARVTTTEGALIQGVAATLDCPLPPSIYGKTHP
jgi:hypothetical protein